MPAGLYAGLRQDSRRADVALLASDRPSAAAGCMGDTAAAVLMVVAEAGKQGAPAGACGDVTSQPACRPACLPAQAGTHLLSSILRYAGPPLLAAGGAEAMRACRDEVGAALGVDPALVEVQACGGGGGGGGSTSGLDRVLAAVPLLAERLDGGAEASHHAACAACGEGSWDTATKEAALEVGGGRYRGCSTGGAVQAVQYRRGSTGRAPCMRRSAATPGLAGLQGARAVLAAGARRSPSRRLLPAAGAAQVPLGRGGSAVRLGGMAHASPGGIQVRWVHTWAGGADGVMVAPMVCRVVGSRRFPCQSASAAHHAADDLALPRLPLLCRRCLPACPAGHGDLRRAGGPRHLARHV